ncbi:MAG TPA: cupin domain-containing protein [Chitinophagaceae bacterium]|nr:cupin domain-containing protein [Chitinophagaceae bacterium]
MITRRQFVGHGSTRAMAFLLSPIPAFPAETTDFDGLVVNENEGEAFQLRDGRAIVRIKISKRQGAQSISFLASSLPPGDVIPVHKHLNEDEIFFLHRGSGLFTLGEKQYSVSEGAVIIAPKTVWHGLQNTGNETIELRFGYSPSGAEGFFREVGIPVGQPFIQKTMDERKAIAKKWGIVYKN